MSCQLGYSHHLGVLVGLAKTGAATAYIVGTDRRQVTLTGLVEVISGSSVDIVCHANATGAAGDTTVDVAFMAEKVDSTDPAT